MSWLPKKAEMGFVLKLFVVTLVAGFIGVRDFSLEGVLAGFVVSVVFVLLPFPVWRRMRQRLSSHE